MTTISKSPDVFWTKETTKGLSFVPGVDLVPNHKAMKVTSNFKPLPKLPKKHLTKISKAERTNSSKVNKSAPVQKSVQLQTTGCFGDESVGMQSKQVSLKDLCPEDKERVANLIRELAKAGEEKEATESKLNNERKQFVLKLDELKADKEKIEEEQRTLMLEFKECQRLLVFYQQKITEEQKEVARDINRLLTDSSFSKPHIISSSSRKSTPRGRTEGEDFEDITVKEVEETISSHRSAPDSPSSHYPDVTGALGESFRPNSRAARCAAGKEFVYVRKRDAHVGFPSPDDVSESDFKPRELNKTDVTTDDDVQDFSDAFERRIRALSPNGRREALLKQKRELEVQQAHLHSLLAEQEEILRFRQEELKKRHVEYTQRMQHYKRHGAFPPTTSSIDDATEIEDQENSVSSAYKDNGALKHSSRKTTPLADSSSKQRPRSLRAAKSEPVLRSRKFVTYSPTLETSDSNDDVSGTLTNTLPTRHTFSSSYGRPSLRERSQNGMIHDITNVSSKKGHRSSKQSSRVDSSNFSFHKPKAKEPDSEYHSSSLLSHSTMSTRSPHRVHSTMNNLSTLSDLVSSVEASQQAFSASQHTTPLFTSSAASDDTMISMTFDPEDSQLLEDIFFIS